MHNIMELCNLEQHIFLGCLAFQASFSSVFLVSQSSFLHTYQHIIRTIHLTSDSLLLRFSFIHLDSLKKRQQCVIMLIDQKKIAELYLTHASHRFSLFGMFYRQLNVIAIYRLTSLSHNHFHSYKHISRQFTYTFLFAVSYIACLY